MAVKIQLHVSWVVTQCIVVALYHRFGGPCFLLLQGEVKVDDSHSAGQEIICCYEIQRLVTVTEKDSRWRHGKYSHWLQSNRRGICTI